ncbi:MAG: hypothetical protein ACKVPX_16320, partial [Myxococcaceae bacterium]
MRNSSATTHPVVRHAPTDAGLPDVAPRFLESLLSGAERTTDQQRTLQALVAENGNAVYDALGGAFRTLRAG